MSPFIFSYLLKMMKTKSSDILGCIKFQTKKGGVYVAPSKNLSMVHQNDGCNYYCFSHEQANGETFIAALNVDDIAAISFTIKRK